MKYSISELTGYAWECAIDNVKNILSNTLESYSIEKFFSIEILANNLGIRFDENGGIFNE